MEELEAVGVRSGGPNEQFLSFLECPLRAKTYRKFGYPNYFHEFVRVVVPINIIPDDHGAAVQHLTRNGLVVWGISVTKMTGHTIIISLSTEDAEKVVQELNARGLGYLIFDTSLIPLGDAEEKLIWNVYGLMCVTTMAYADQARQKLRSELYLVSQHVSRYYARDNWSCWVICCVRYHYRLKWHKKGQGVVFSDWDLFDGPAYGVRVAAKGIAHLKWKSLISTRLPQNLQDGPDPNQFRHELVGDYCEHCGDPRADLASKCQVCEKVWDFKCGDAAFGFGGGKPPKQSVFGGVPWTCMDCHVRASRPGDGYCAGCHVELKENSNVITCQCGRKFHDQFLKNCTRPLKDSADGAEWKCLACQESI